MEQTQTQELRITFTTDSGKTVGITVPDVNLDEVTSDTAVEIFTAAKAPLTNDSSTTIVQATDGGNVIGIKRAYIVNAVETTILENY